MDVDVDEDADAADVEPEPEAEAESVAEASEADGAPTTATPKKKTRRGSRGGRGRKKKTAAAPAAAAGGDNGTGEPEDIELPVPAETSAEAPAPKIHIPAPDLGEAEEDTPAEPAEDGADRVLPAEEEDPSRQPGRARPKEEDCGRRHCDGFRRRRSNPAVERAGGGKSLGLGVRPDVPMGRRRALARGAASATLHALAG